MEVVALLRVVVVYCPVIDIGFVAPGSALFANHGTNGMLNGNTDDDKSDFAAALPPTR